MNTAETPRSLVSSGWLRAVRIMGRIGLFVVSVTFFILSLMLMKAGAGPLTPLIRSNLSVDSPASALGFGWLSANVALSGSPVAATALTFLDAGVLSINETFAMIAGSRLGAAMLVLLIGFVYVLRGKQRDLSLGVGLLSLLVTQTIYPAVLLLGFFLLSRGWINTWQVHATQDVQSPFQLFFDPIIVRLRDVVPDWTILLFGFFLVIFSLWLFDRAIPTLHLSEARAGMVRRMLYRPMVTFIIGAVVTMITMSVSVSLGLLVPLSVRGYVRRENVIPYILGANITTFIDTLIAAALLMNPAAVNVVLVQMCSVALVSMVVLVTSFRPYLLLVERLVVFISQSRVNLILYVSLIIVLPLMLVILG